MGGEGRGREGRGGEGTGGEGREGEELSKNGRISYMNMYTHHLNPIQPPDHPHTLIPGCLHYTFLTGHMIIWMGV